MDEITEKLLFENKELKKEVRELREALTAMEKVQKQLTKVGLFIHDMKVAFSNSDEQFKQAVSLFHSIEVPDPIPPDVFYIAQLFQSNRSLTFMAEAILGDKTKKSRMNRLLQAAKQSHPQLFEARTDIKAPT